MSSPPQPPSVLIVDDDPSILAVLRRITSSLPARVRFAVTFAEAWQAVQDEPPHILVADYRLPDGDGLSLVERVLARWPNTRCVLHTGEAVTRTSIGLDIPVLAKPCPPETVRDLISEQLADLDRT
jgi:DNA-binding NtrC family response regulator